MQYIDESRRRPVSSLLHAHPPPSTSPGEGRYSSVRGCLKRVDGCPYAVKRLAHRLRNAADRAHCLREAFAWAALADCPKLVRCVFFLLKIVLGRVCVLLIGCFVY